MKMLLLLAVLAAGSNAAPAPNVVPVAINGSTELRAAFGSSIATAVIRTVQLPENSPDDGETNGFFRPSATGLGFSIAGDSAYRPCRRDGSHHSPIVTARTASVKTGRVFISHQHAVRFCQLK